MYKCFVQTFYSVLLRIWGVRPSPLFNASEKPMKNIANRSIQDFILSYFDLQRNCLVKRYHCFISYSSDKTRCCLSVILSSLSLFMCYFVAHVVGRFCYGYFRSEMPEFFFSVSSFSAIYYSSYWNNLTDCFGCYMPYKKNFI